MTMSTMVVGFVLGVAIASEEPPFSQEDNSIEQARTLQARAERRFSELKQSEQALADRLNEHLERFHDAVQNIREDDVYGEFQALQILAEMSEILRALASQAIEGHQVFRLSAEDYRQALMDAHPLLVKAADEYRKFSEEESFAGLSSLYLSQANTLDAIAAKTQQAIDDFDLAMQTVDENLVYVKRTDVFLDRYSSFAEIVGPSLIDDRMFRELESYVEYFEHFRDAVLLFEGRVSNDVPADSPPTSSPHYWGTRLRIDEPIDLDVDEWAPVRDRSTLRSAVHAANASNHNSAIEHYSRFINTSGPDARVLYNRAIQYTKTNRWSNAVSDLKQALSIEPNFIQAALLLTSIAIECPDSSIADPERARSDAIEICRVTDFQNAAALSVLAEAEAVNGDRVAAAYWQRRALEFTSIDDRHLCRTRIRQYEEVADPPDRPALFVTTDIEIRQDSTRLLSPSTPTRSSTETSSEANEPEDEAEDDSRNERDEAIQRLEQLNSYYRRNPRSTEAKRQLANFLMNCEFRDLRDISRARRLTNALEEQLRSAYARD